jgi:hypothetical protein
MPKSLMFRCGMPRTFSFPFARPTFAIPLLERNDEGFHDSPKKKSHR